MRSPQRVAAWAVAAGLVGAMALPATAQDSSDTITVAGDGSADHASIADAIAAAVDGDTVLLGPGTYDEGFVLDKDITLAGSGSRDEVVIVPSQETETTWEAPWGERIPVAVHLKDSDATIEHLSFRFEGDHISLLTEGGAPTFHDVSIIGNDVAMFSGEPTFRDAYIDAYFAVRGASPTMEDSELLGHASVDGPGRTVIRTSTLRGGTSASADATGAYEDNLFIGQQLGVDSRSDMLIAGNIVRDVEGNEPGILVVGVGSSAEIVGNTVENAAVGISVDSPEPGSSVVGNTVRNVRVGIHVASKGETRIEDNEITDASTFGILLQGGQPIVVGNRICGTEQAFELRGGTEPQFGTNEVCEE